ncbi:MAG: anti-sigma factor family protein [Gaiellaceae bacterium]
MTDKHPDELALLAYVEEELAADDRREVVEHLVACRSCAESVRRLEAGRTALRAAPLLDLPEGRREELVAALPERRDPWRPFRPVRRALVVAAPVAAAAAFVGVFVLATQLDLGGGDDDSGDAGEAAQVAEDAGGGAEMERTDTGGADTSAKALDAPGTLVRSVAGPPAEVVRLLEAEGIAAEVVEGAVVAEGRAGEVEAALEGRAAGPVDVYVK